MINESKDFGLQIRQFKKLGIIFIDFRWFEKEGDLIEHF